MFEKIYVFLKSAVFGKQHTRTLSYVNEDLEVTFFSDFRISNEKKSVVVISFRMFSIVSGSLDYI